MTPIHVLFLCTGNSARSILAEATLNHVGKGRFVAHSAGSHPAGRVHPQALRQLQAEGIPVSGYRSKSWDEFAGPDAPRLDLVVTVCDNAARETCPVLFGDFVLTHWGLPDPAAITGSAETVERAFAEAHRVVTHRIAQLLQLPFHELDRARLERAPGRDRDLAAMNNARRLFAEGLGTAALLAIVVGSGIMGERLAGGSEALALLANSLATGAGLYVLITLLAPVSGAHFNPLVSAAMWWRGELAARTAMGYALAQILGAALGAVLANLMFDLAPIELSEKVRAGSGIWLSEIVATCGLLLTVLLGARYRPASVAALVGAYITAAYWFTASTSFANPAVTMARSLTATFTGIRPGDVPAFVMAQCVGMVLGVLLYSALVPRPEQDRAGITE